MFVPSIATERSNARSIPLIVVNIAVTETMPMMMPSVVSSARSLLAQIVTRAMRTLSANSNSGRRNGSAVGGGRGEATGAAPRGCGGRPPPPRTPPPPPRSAGRARLHLGLDLLRLLRDAGAEHARAGLRDHHVVLDADAAEAAPALDGVVVDEVGV